MATIVTGDQSISIGNKLAEIQRQLYLQRDGYPYSISELEAHLQAAVEGRFSNHSFACGSTENQLKSWADLYRAEFGQTLDFSGIKIPEKRDEFNRLIVVAKNMTMSRVYAAGEKKFSCWCYTDDLDKNIPTNDRTPTEHYALWVRDRQEADEELKNLSADDLAEQKIPGITLLERLLLELKYFRETGKHLDVQNVTLCSGSRRADCDVPNADWNGGKFRVDWSCRDSRCPDLRSRAISL